MTDQPCPETVDIHTRIERLERRIDMLSRTLALLVNAAVSDACKGLTEDEFAECQATGVQAVVGIASELRAAS